MRGILKSFPGSFSFFALLLGYLLSDLLGVWVIAPVARGLGFFLAVLAFAPFLRKRQIEFWRVLIVASYLGGVALIWSVILRQMRLE